MQDELLKAGVAEVLVFAANDCSVMKAWRKDQKMDGQDSIFTFFSDPQLTLTKAMGLVLQEESVLLLTGNPRTKRCSLLVEDCVVKVVNIAFSPDDPAGEKNPGVTLADKMLTDARALQGATT